MQFQHMPSSKNEEKIVFLSGLFVFFVVFVLFLSLSFSLQKACFWRIICSFALIDRSNVFQCTTLTLTSPWIAIIPPHNSYRIVSRIFALHCPLSCLCNSGNTCCIGNKNSLSLSLSLNAFLQGVKIWYNVPILPPNFTINASNVGVREAPCKKSFGILASYWTPQKSSKCPFVFGEGGAGSENLI